MPLRYIPDNLDFKLSPYTGMTRESWISAAKHLLKGIFSNISDIDSPVIMPRRENDVTYPHRGSTGVWLEVEKKAEIFEGLTRSLFIAAPVIKNEPEAELCGIRLRDYYKRQILRSCSSGDELSVGTYDELMKMTDCKDPVRCFQQTVETCALVIGLWVSKEQIWDCYTQEEKDTIAVFLASYTNKPTVPQNWRLFNMLDMAFLHMNGYQIDKEIMTDHASEILGYYAGDGWYRDGQSFDYYSCWAFNVYAPLWNIWYGYENMPEIAAAFEAHSNRLMETYPDFFDEDGLTNMWGRSNIYRCAATGAFDANAYLKNPGVNYGLARRICSGSLLQFIGREDFYYVSGSDDDKTREIYGLPNMGFYGQFTPLVQGYSCAESPFWMGKAFLCLDLPADHPFWTSKEENGSWETLQQGEVKETALDGPGLCFTNHKSNGTTILRTGKVVKSKGDIHGMWNYSKLVFSTKYPWEAAEKDNVESMQYMLRDIPDGNVERCNVTFWHGIKDGVLYRRQFFGYDLVHETHWLQAVNLADIAVPYGILRTDRIRLFKKPVEITLGSFGFPDNGTEITERTDKTGKAKAVILKGRDSLGNEKQLAMTIWDGWNGIKYEKHRETNPESERSIVIYAYGEQRKLYGGAENHMLISQTITKESLDDFDEDEIFPITEIKYGDRDSYGVGAYGRTEITLKTGKVYSIDFSNFEGRLML